MKTSLKTTLQAVLHALKYAEDGAWKMGLILVRCVVEAICGTLIAAGFCAAQFLSWGITFADLATESQANIDRVTVYASIMVLFTVATWFMVYLVVTSFLDLARLYVKWRKERRQPAQPIPALDLASEVAG